MRNLWWDRFVCVLVLAVFTFQTVLPLQYAHARNNDRYVNLIRSSDTSANVVGSLFEQVAEWLVPAAQAQSIQGSTPEFDLSDPYLIQKASELGNDPVRIFEFVRDEIQYEVYSGSLRGARGALWEGAGNSFDQASLLIALLRISGYEASYQQGTLALGDAQSLILSMFDPAPYRVVGIVADDDEKADPANDPELLTDASAHTWVEATLSGQPQSLDPSFKAAQPGDAFTSVDAAYVELPEQWRHRVNITLQAEVSGFASLSGYNLPRDDVLEASFAVAELAGKTLSLSHFVNSQATAGFISATYTHIYTPFLALVENDGNIQDDDITLGTDYQELTTTFIGALANSRLTGLFLQIENVRPGGQAEMIERTLVDRIGYAARNGLFVDSSTVVPMDSDPAQPALGMADVFTLSISGAEAALPDFALPTDEITSLVDEAGSVTEALFAADTANPSDEVLGLVDRSIALTRFLAMHENQIFISRFLNASHDLDRGFADTYLAKGYLAEPRIILQSNRSLMQDNSVKKQTKMDLAKNKINVVIFPEQSTLAEFSYRLTRGFLEVAIEDQVLRQIEQQLPNGAVISSESVPKIFEAADEQGIDSLYLIPGQSDDLSNRDYSATAKKRINQALSNGKLVLIPERSVTLNGRQTVGWFEVDPITGEVIDSNENGEHVAFIFWGLVSLPFIGNVDGLISGFVVGFTVPVFTYIGLLLACEAGTEPICSDGNTSSSSKEVAVELVQKAFRKADEVKALINRRAPSAVPTFDVGFQQGKLAAISALKKTIQTDPPLPNILIGLSADEPATSASAGIAIVPEPFFTLPVDDVQVPSLFRALIRNDTAETQTYTVTVPNASNDFTIRTSLSRVTVPAGETGVVGVLMIPPEGELPASGTAVPFEVSVQADSEPAATVVSAELVMPEVVNLEIDLAPSRMATQPGGQVDAVVSIRATGNADAIDRPLSLSLDDGLSVVGLPATVSVAAGQTIELPVTLQVAPGTLNQSLGATVTVSFGADLDGTPYTSNASASVVSRSAEIIPIESYAICAADAGNSDVARVAGNIAEVTAQLQTDPDSSTLRQRLAFHYGQLAELAAINNALSNFTDLILNLQGLVLTAPFSTILQETEAFYVDRAPQLCGAFALNMSLPQRIELEPQQNSSLPLRLENSGSEPLTLNLTLGSVPADTSASLSQTTVALAPGEVIDGNSPAPVVVTLDQSFIDDQRFTLRVNATVTEIAGFTISASSLVSIRSSYADVVDVRVNPAALDSGAAQATVRAEIVNSANTRRDVLGLLEVTDATGNVIQSLDPLPFTLTTGFEPITVDFGVVNFNPLADGAYRMQLSLLAAADTPLAGQSASGGFLVGAPVAATVEPTPILLPPGDATTTVSINVERQFDGTTGIGGIQPTDPSISRVNWASASEGSTISTGGFLLDGVANGTNTFSTATLANPMVLDLGVVRTFDNIHLHLWDGDDRAFRYLIEYSEDGVNYASLVDRLAGGMRGPQIERFEPIDTRFLRFSGDSTSNASLHFINELLVLGDETATPFVTEIIEIDGLADSGSSFTSGQRRNLSAGLYEVRYLDGAMSPWPADTFNGGRTWQVTVRTEVPQFNKNYQIGFLEDIISRFATPQEAEASQQGTRFTFYLPARSDVYFWVNDPNAGDNRGAQRIQLRQISGANDSLIVRVQDAMTRSVLWEQAAVAQWDTWIRTSNRDCFGCHIQTQGSSGLSIAKQKIPSLPLDNRLTDEFIDAYQFWLASNGRVDGTNSHDFTRTALWAWAVSNFDDVDIDTLKVPLLRSLDWLEARQNADGSWTADHTGTAAENVYRDGVPTATHTAGNIQALARAINLIDVENEMPFTEVTVDDNLVDMQRNISNEMWLRFAPLDNVTGLMLTISDTFASNSNFVINEFDVFNGDQIVTIDGVEASRNQSSFNILESNNNILNITNDGWAVNGNTIGNPASGLWRFNVPQLVDRIRITQLFNTTHQLETFTVWYTTDTNPTLASNFIPLPLELVGLTNLEERQGKYLSSLLMASDFFSRADWDFRRNIRSAAQTIFGLTDALPFLDNTRRALAESRIIEADNWLRSVQNADGGWGNRAGDLSRVFHTAQALEALLESAQSTVDPAILDGAEYLLLMQRTAGNWNSPPLDSSLAATTWTQIALPTIFENFTGLTLSLQHDMPDDPATASLISGSDQPPLASDSTADLLRWNGILTGSEVQTSFNFDLSVPNLQPGEIRQVSDGTVVDYISVDGGGQLVLDPIFVAGAHIIDITPAELTMADEPVTYDVLLDNPTDVEQTYTLNVSGLDDVTVTLPAMVTIPANTQTTVPLSVAPVVGIGGDRDFIVDVVTSTGGVDLAQSRLLFAGAVDIPIDTPDPIDLTDRGVDIQLLPAALNTGQGNTAAFIARVTNIGDVNESYVLGGNFPAGFNVEWLETQVSLTPGANNFRDVGLLLTPPLGTAVSDYAFTVTATAVNDNSVSDSDDGLLNLLPLGVDVSITPTQTAASTTVSLTITNQGETVDTYDLSLAGPVANFTTLTVDQITLQPGETQTLPLAIGALDFSLPAQWFLQALATSQTDSGVRDLATAEVLIPVTQSVSAAFEPDLITLDDAGAVSSQLRVTNAGNVEDSYVATIRSVSAPLTANLLGLNDEPTIEVVGFRLPPFTDALIPLEGVMDRFGRSNVIVDVVSLSNAAVSDTATLAVNYIPPGPVGITLTESDGDTVVEESGTSDTVDVVLDRLTIGEVTLSIAMSDDTEATVTPPTLTFDPSNWDVPQTVTITGVDDGVIDGDQISQLLVTVIDAIDDPDYAALPPATVDVTTLDVVAGEMLISPLAIMVIEGNEGIGFNAMLNRQPAADVSVDLSVSDNDLISLSATSLTFSPDNWDVPQTVIVTAVDDDIAQETLNLQVLTDLLQSSDSSFAGFDPANVDVTRFDDELGGGNPGPSAALWAQGGDDRAIDWAGGTGRVDGLTHSNGGIRLRGNDKQLIGGAEYVTSLDARGGTYTFEPQPQQVSEKPWPYQHQLADYQPGGRAALAAGDQYFDLSAECGGNGVWQRNAGDAPLAEGLYWIPCDVALNVSGLSGELSIVASGSMQITGSAPQGISHFSDGILFWSEASGANAIKLSGSGLNLSGYQFARNGEIDVSGSDMVLACGLAAASLKLNGANLLFSGDGCSTPQADDVVVTTLQGEAVAIQLSGSDLDGDALSYTIASTPQNGLLDGSGSVYVYQPATEFVGEDQFSYQVDDGVRRSAAATVTIVVTATRSDDKGPATPGFGQNALVDDVFGDGGNEPVAIPALNDQQRWLLMLLLLLVGWATLYQRRSLLRRN
ncbi:MAG: hypothetical protein Tsb002_14940 [Wenzhouxiangellaceae bacterium]